MLQLDLDLLIRLEELSLEELDALSAWVDSVKATRRDEGSPATPRPIQLHLPIVQLARRVA